MGKEEGEEESGPEAEVVDNGEKRNANAFHFAIEDGGKSTKLRRTRFGTELIYIKRSMKEKTRKELRGKGRR